MTQNRTAPTTAYDPYQYMGGQYDPLSYQRALARAPQRANPNQNTAPRAANGGSGFGGGPATMSPQDWLARYQAMSPRNIDSSVSHDSQNSRSYDAGTGGYNSDANNTATQQLGADLKRDYLGSNVGDTMRNSVAYGGFGNHVRAAGAYKSWKKSKADQNARILAAQEQARIAAANGVRDYANQDNRVLQQFDDASSRGQTLTPQEVQQRLEQFKRGDQQDALDKEVDGFYGSPARTQEYDNVYHTAKDNYYGQVADAYGKAFTTSVQGTAGQGLMGGSQDISRRGDMERARTAAYTQAEGDAYGDSNSLRDEDRQTSNSLHQLIRSGDTGNGEAASAALQYARGEGDASRQQRALYSQGRDINRFSDNLMSQAYAQPINGASDWVNAYYGQGARGATRY